uniref:Uncharacterized protein n=1 Tax=Arundo donax TaxID=35708 RepID=A0A0A8Z6D8_ARUDO
MVGHESIHGPGSVQSVRVGSISLESTGWVGGVAAAVLNLQLLVLGLCGRSVELECRTTVPCGFCSVA